MASEVQETEDRLQRVVPGSSVSPQHPEHEIRFGWRGARDRLVGHYDSGVTRSRTCATSDSVKFMRRSDQSPSSVMGMKVVMWYPIA